MLRRNFSTMLSLFPLIGFKTKKMVKVYIVHTDLFEVSFKQCKTNTTIVRHLYYSDHFPLPLIVQAPKIRPGCPLYVFKKGNHYSQLHVVSNDTTLIVDESKMIIEEKYYEAK